MLCLHSLHSMLLSWCWETWGERKLQRTNYFCTTCGLCKYINVSIAWPQVHFNISWKTWKPPCCHTSENFNWLLCRFVGLGTFSLIQKKYADKSICIGSLHASLKIWPFNLQYSGGLQSFTLLPWLKGNVSRLYTLLKIFAAYFCNTYTLTPFTMQLKKKFFASNAILS